MADQGDRLAHFDVARVDAANGDALTFSVAANSNPSLVTTSIVGGRLQLSYAAGQTGKKQFNKLMRLEKSLGRANMAFVAGAIIISPAIAMGIFRSQRRMGLIGRLFNR